jgi:shikimate dehydrogenase
VLLALVERGCTSALLLVRDPARAEQTVAAVGAHPRAPALAVSTIDDARDLSADVVVSTVPGTAQTPELVAACAAVPAVFEVVYDPWPTPLASAAAASGRPLVTGLDLLAHQAALQVQLMTGAVVPVALVREAGLAELRRRGAEPPRDPLDIA